MIQNRRLHPALEKVRFSVKPLEHQNGRPVELARTMRVHPLSYQELPYDPEYSLYAGRLTPETLNLATADEMYWKVRRELIFRHTGEHPFEIRGKDAEMCLNRIFPRDVSKVKTGRCSYQFACYHDGGMITDGLLLRLSDNSFGTPRRMAIFFPGIRLILTIWKWKSSTRKYGSAKFKVRGR